MRRNRTHPEKVKRRKGILEPAPHGPCGVPLWNDRQEHEPGLLPCLPLGRLTRGLSNEGTEMTLSVLAYNHFRAISILGVAKMIRALR